MTQRSINLEYARIVDQELREAVFGSHDVHEKLPHLGSAFDELAAIVSIAKIASFSHSCFEGSLQPMGVVSLHDHDAWILVVRLVTTLQCAQCTRPPPKLANVLVDATTANKHVAACPRGQVEYDVDDRIVAPVHGLDRFPGHTRARTLGEEVGIATLRELTKASCMSLASKPMSPSVAAQL